MSRSWGVSRGQRGSVAAEFVLVTPLLVVLLLFVAFGGRLVMARGDVDSAARDAALGGGTAPCRQVGVSVDTGAFSAGGSVAVAVTCEVMLADLALLGVPGTRTLTGQATAPVDVYRGTQ